MRTNTVVMLAKDTGEAALKAMCNTWGERTCELIASTIVESAASSKTTVYTAEWLEACGMCSPSFIEAYVQVYDEDLSLYSVHTCY